MDDWVGPKLKRKPVILQEALHILIGIFFEQYLRRVSPVFFVIQSGGSRISSILPAFCLFFSQKKSTHFLDVAFNP